MTLRYEPEELSVTAGAIPYTAWGSSAGLFLAHSRIVQTLSIRV